MNNLKTKQKKRPNMQFSVETLERYAISAGRLNTMSKVKEYSVLNTDFERKTYILNLMQ